VDYIASKQVCEACFQHQNERTNIVLIKHKKLCASSLPPFAVITRSSQHFFALCNYIPA